MESTPERDGQYAAARPASRGKNKQFLLALVIAALLIVGAGAYYVYSQYFADPVVATVNGKKIHQSEFDESHKLIEDNAAQQGLDIADATTAQEIKDQAMEVLVSNALLVSAAQSAGISYADDEVQQKYDELVTQFGDEAALKTRMEELELTEKKLRANIAERLLTDAYIESVTDIETLSVSDEEIQEFLTSLDLDVASLPPMEEIRPQIEAQILAQKQQQIVTDLIEKLRGEATIDIKQ